MTSPAQPTRRPLLDPGWLFLLAGLALVAATVLIPAIDDLEEAKLVRERALVAEAHSARRLENYATYLDALSRGDEDLLLSLAATQLNLAPADRVVLTVPNEPPTQDVSVFPALEPSAPPTVYRVTPDTVLQRWTTNDRTRLWLMAGGVMCVLFGLLPPTIARAR